MVRYSCSAPLQSGTTQLDSSKLQNPQAFPNPQYQLPVLAALHRTDGEETTFFQLAFLKATHNINKLAALINVEFNCHHK